MLEGAFHGNFLCVENGRLIHKNDTLLPGLVLGNCGTLEKRVLGTFRTVAGFTHQAGDNSDESLHIDAKVMFGCRVLKLECDAGSAFGRPFYTVAF